MANNKLLKIAIFSCCFLIFAAATAACAYFYIHSPDPEGSGLLIAAVLADSLVVAYAWRAYSRTPPPAAKTARRRFAKVGNARNKRISYTDGFLVTNIPSVLCIKDGSGKWLWAKNKYLSFFNLCAINYAGKDNSELSSMAGANIEALEFDDQQDSVTWSLAGPRKDPLNRLLRLEEKRYDVIRIPIYGRDGKPLRLLVTGTSRWETQSIKSRIFPAVFFSSHICFMLLNSEFNIILVNRALLRLTGFTEEECLQHDMFFLEYENETLKRPNIRSLFAEDPARLWSHELTCRRKDGEAMPVNVLISVLNVPGADKKTPYYIVNMYDITAQKNHENRILRLAHYDDLTGLPNRIMFCDRLAEALAQAKQQKSCVVVLFLDLDRFKQVNDTIGHQAGNALLKEVAERVKATVGEEHIVARLSGDEFAILATHEKSYENAVFFSTVMVQKIISNISKSFYIHRRNVFVGTSIGISIFPEDANTSEDLLRNADMAMYEAKRQGRNGYQFFNADYRTKLQHRNQIETGLRDVLNKGELQLYYQPQRLSKTRELWGAEVLLRWIPGYGKMIPPDQFIPIAEDTGVIVPIGKWILETACTQQKKWLASGYGIKHISVNVSARQFSEPNFVDTVEEILAKTQLEAKYLELEITESVLIGDPKKIELQLAWLKKIGVSIALDDFGTGYSSLSYLNNFPIDVLKIDKSFVKDMKEESKKARIVCAIIDIGHSLGQKVVAEGVETDEQFNYLLRNGCDIIQGYYFSRPLPTSDMVKFLQDESAKKAVFAS